MSLILEALRKSEERRRLGETPTLISESAWSSRRRHPLARGASRWWLVLPLLVVAGVTGWWLGWRDAGRDAPAPVRPAAAVAEKPARLRDSTTPSGTAAASLSLPPSELPSLPQSAADATATAKLDPEARRKFESGEVFANSAAQIQPVEPTREVPYVPPEAALPAPLPEPEAVAVAASAPAPPGPAVPAQAVVAAPIQPAPAPAVAATPAPAIAATPAPAIAATPAPTVAPTPAPQGALPATAPGVPVMLIWELPLATRKALPTMSLSMHVYAADPARRFAWIDDKRVSEGSPLNNDLNVIEITPDGVVLDFRGQRFLLPRSGR